MRVGKLIILIGQKMIGVPLALFAIVLMLSASAITYYRKRKEKGVK